MDAADRDPASRGGSCRSVRTVRFHLHIRLPAVFAVLLWSAGTGVLVALPEGVPQGLVALHAATAGIGLLALWALSAERLALRHGCLVRGHLLSVARVPMTQVALLHVDRAAERATVVSRDSRTLLELDLYLWPVAALERFFASAGVEVVREERGRAARPAP